MHTNSHTQRDRERERASERARTSHLQPDPVTLLIDPEPQVRNSSPIPSAPSCRLLTCQAHGTIKNLRLHYRSGTEITRRTLLSCPRTSVVRAIRQRRPRKNSSETAVNPPNPCGCKDTKQNCLYHLLADLLACLQPLPNDYP